MQLILWQFIAAIHGGMKIGYISNILILIESFVREGYY